MNCGICLKNKLHFFVVFEVEKFDPDSMNQVCLNSLLPLLRFGLACPYLSRFVFWNVLEAEHS